MLVERRSDVRALGAAQVPGRRYAAVRGRGGGLALRGHGQRAQLRLPAPQPNVPGVGRARQRGERPALPCGVRDDDHGSRGLLAAP